MTLEAKIVFESSGDGGMGKATRGGRTKEWYDKNILAELGKQTNFLTGFLKPMTLFKSLMSLKMIGQLTLISLALAAQLFVVKQIMNTIDKWKGFFEAENKLDYLFNEGGGSKLISGFGGGTSDPSSGSAIPGGVDANEIEELWRQFGNLTFAREEDRRVTKIVLKDYEEEISRRFDLNEITSLGVMELLRETAAFQVLAPTYERTAIAAERLATAQNQLIQTNQSIEKIRGGEVTGDYSSDNAKYQAQRLAIDLGPGFYVDPRPEFAHIVRNREFDEVRARLDKKYGLDTGA